MQYNVSKNAMVTTKGQNRFSGKKKEPKPKLLVRIFSSGVGVFHVGAQKFDMSLEAREIKLLGRDIPGFCRDVPGVPAEFEKKSCVQFSFPRFRISDLLRVHPTFFPGPSSLKIENLSSKQQKAIRRTTYTHFARYLLHLCPTRKRSASSRTSVWGWTLALSLIWGSGKGFV